MRKIIVLLLLVGMCGVVYADLQNVTVGGQIRIRGRIWDDTLTFNASGPPAERIPAFLLPNRPIGPFGTFSRYDWDNAGNDLKYFEEKTRLNVHAFFTDDVSAFVELESFDVWGQDFRSDYVTGADNRANSVDDLEVLHSYIQMDKVFDLPLRLRVGRYDLKLGKGWLVNDMMTACLSMSHDGLRLTYDTDDWTVDAWMSKVFEANATEQDGDTDFYGVYATYKPLQAVDISAYWMWMRDAGRRNDTNGTWAAEWLENVLGLDDYDVSNLHTVGLRAFGKTGQLDYDLELAYQFGNADVSGVGFKEHGYGDTHAKYDGNWAGDLEVGYTFDCMMKPRVFAGAAYFSGEDNRDLSIGEWLNPFDRPDSSISFNRLFSGIGYGWTFDVFQNTSNFYQFRLGSTVKPTEKLAVTGQVSYQAVVEPFDLPKMVSVGRYRVPVWPELSFWTDESSRDMGWMTYLWGQYNYTEDLFVRAGWEHLFTGEAFEDGSFTSGNGLQFSGGTDRDGADYYFVDMGLNF
jgi:hypothetical protein